MAGETTDILGMSDDDFLKLNSPPEVSSGGEGGEQSEENKTPVQITEDDPATAVDDDDGTGGEGGGGGTNDEYQGGDDENKNPTGEEDQNGDKLATKDKSLEQGKTDTGATIVDPADKAKGKDGLESKKEDSPSGSKAEGQPSPPDYEGFYKQVMAPLKANGKTIELKTPQEAVQLMQMGANYTKKMQAIQPYRKVLMMLENNGLLDEGKLSFLIDIEKKNPEAIKKLIKEAGIDPLEIDTSTEPTYQEGHHRVSDEEAAFVSVLEDLRSTQDGTETLQTINSQWDQASKEVLWKTPELMTTIHQQRANGIYDRIATEVERRRTLGAIPAQVPFLQAYKVVGDELDAAGAFRDLVQPTQVQPKPSTVHQPVVTRVQQPKAPANGDKVSAASSTRTTPLKTEKVINPLAMSDDDFLKQMADRL